jgi:hypothetical protein
MEKIEIIGDLVTIRETTFNINDIVSIKPQSLVQAFIPYGSNRPKITGRDFPKIIVQTKIERLEFAFSSDEDRDEVLREFIEQYKIAHASKNQQKLIHQNQGGNISINVAESSNVSIINQSKGSSITNNNLSEANEKINEIRQELEKYRIDYNSEVDEIAEVLVDIESKINERQNIPRLTFKSLIESSSNLSSIGALVISLGQILGIIAPTN